MLNDRQIREAIDDERIIISPREGIEARIESASLDVRLGNSFATYDRFRSSLIDVKRDSSHMIDQVTVDEEEGYVAHPHQFILATTLERIALPTNLAARLEGKSSVGRLGIIVHSTAGFIDPGFGYAGTERKPRQITLEMSVINHLPVRIYPGMRIAQLAFHPVEEVSAGYQGKYVDQEGPTPSRYHLNWTGSGWT